MRRVAIVGVGHSKFGDRQDVNLRELAFEAVKPALEDAGVSPREISYVAVGTVGSWYEELFPAVPVAEYCGLSGASLVRVEAACASGGAAVHAAYMAVASGLTDVALVVGIEKMREVDTPLMVEFLGRGGSYLWEFENFGMTFPGYYALFATAYMNRYGATEEDLALVSVKAHKYAAINPLAHLQKEISIEQALNSIVVSWPLKLYDCSPISDGSAALVLASEEKVKELRADTPIWIAGIGSSSSTANLSYREDLLGIESAIKASQRAYKMAGLGPDRIDVASVHDCFTIAELLAYEDLGFCRRGEGYKMIREGETEIGGRIPVNIDGGLKAKGHPIGATGVAMVAEQTKQLREEVKPTARQAPLKNYTALTHNVGGTGHYCYVTILKR
ncbi:MAG: thiolase domain-containing protein [Nitrososphaerota archaeon]|nr:thiolase domain-containing protein [Candidatus Calditenuaceae archaeon]MDW8072850.1 thiolase domain-containing protein [Nitrososphaerota archaeon]